MKVREFSCTASSKRICDQSSCLFVCGLGPPFVSAGRAETRRVARGGMLLAKAAASELPLKSIIKINLGLQAKKQLATRNRATARSAPPAAFVVARQRKNPRCAFARRCVCGWGWGWGRWRATTNACGRRVALRQHSALALRHGLRLRLASRTASAAPYRACAARRTRNAAFAAHEKTRT